MRCSHTVQVSIGSSRFCRCENESVYWWKASGRFLGSPVWMESFCQIHNSEFKKSMHSYRRKSISEEDAIVFEIMKS